MTQPRTFRGTRDFLPPELIGRRRIQEIIEKTYRRYGFQPLETPAIEYYDILTGKSEETDKLIYKLEHKGDALGLRYDLTVPLARVIAQHKILPRPFKRYQIQPVWRADRPQLRRGRFREFVQCDADIVGTSSLLADAEIVALTYEILKALGFNGFIIRLSSRKLLRGMAILVCGNEDGVFPLCRCIDKLDKIGWDGVQKELAECGFSDDVRARVKQFCGLWDKGPDWAAAEAVLQGMEVGLDGVREVREVYERSIQLGVPADYLKPDLTLARGLDYYTGPIYETVLPDKPHIGSLSGGGRYDGLVATFSDEDVPATGTTLGLDRIQTAMKELSLFEESASLTDALIAQFDTEGLPAALALAARLRKADLNIEVWYDTGRLKKQFAYADRQKIPFVIILGPDERAENKVTVKTLSTGDQQTIPETELIALLESATSFYAEPDSRALPELEMVIPNKEENMKEQSNTLKQEEKEIFLIEEFKKIYSQQSREATKRTRFALVGLIVGVLGLIAMVFFGIKGLEKSVSNIKSSVEEVGNRVERVEKGILAEKFTITTPLDGAIVNRIDLVRGTTPFAQMNHYIVVTPLKTGDDWIQDGPITVYTGGLWTGRAVFGEAAVGAGEEFIVRSLATKLILSPGPLTEVPEDAIFSESITVTRKE